MTMPEIQKLREDGRRLVFFSQEPGRMGTCGLVGALLLDVFSFKRDLVFRLDGGCVAWGRYLDTNSAMARTVEPLKMRLARREAERKAREKAASGGAAAGATP